MNLDAAFAFGRLPPLSNPLSGGKSTQSNSAGMRGLRDR